jgi:hypothetical protein
VSASPLRGEEGAVLVELAPLAHWCTIQSFDTSRIAGALVHQ